MPEHIIYIDEEEIIKEFFEKGIAIRSSYPDFYGNGFFIRITKDSYEFYGSSDMDFSRKNPEARELLEDIALNIEDKYSFIKKYVSSKTKMVYRKDYRNTLKKLITEIRNLATEFGHIIIHHYDDY